MKIRHLISPDTTASLDTFIAQYDGRTSAELCHALIDLATIAVLTVADYYAHFEPESADCPICRSNALVHAQAHSATYVLKGNTASVSDEAYPLAKCTASETKH
jgi:hypothetical protein